MIATLGLMLRRTLPGVVPFALLAACSAPTPAPPASAPPPATTTAAASTKTFSASEKVILAVNACTFLNQGDRKEEAAAKLVNRYKPLTLDEATSIVEHAQDADGPCPK